MTIVTVHEAKTHFSRLVAEVLAGGEVVVAHRGKKPLIKFVAVEPVVKPKRVPGRLQVEGGDSPLRLASVLRRRHTAGSAARGRRRAGKGDRGLVGWGYNY